MSYRTVSFNVIIKLPILFLVNPPEATTTLTLRIIILYMSRLTFHFTSAPRPLHRFSNNAVSHKDVPFWGPENKILHFHPIFAPKPQIFGQFSTGLKISRQKGLKMGMLPCKLPLIVIVAQ